MTNENTINTNYNFDAPEVEKNENTRDRIKLATLKLRELYRKVEVNNENSGSIYKGIN